MDSAANQNAVYHLPTVVCLKGKLDGTIIQGADVYVGRRMTQGGWNLTDSVWMNPFKCKTEAERTQCLISYENYLREQIAHDPNLWNPRLYQLISQGKPLTLGCWCKKNGKNVPCHGDIIVKILGEFVASLQSHVQKHNSFTY